MFYFGPIPWPTAEDLDVGLYVLLCLAFFNFAYALTTARISESIVAINPVFSNRTEYFIIISFFALVSVTNYFATQRWIFDPQSYVGNLGEIYDAYQNATRERTNTGAGGIQVVFSFLRMALFPFILIIFLKNIGENWFKVGAIALILLASSLFRGTDKEIFDFALLLLTGIWYKGLLRKSLVLFVPLVLSALILFTERRIGRFGGSLPMCLPDGVSCFDFQSDLAGFSENLEILYVFATSYLTQGYNALGIALDLNASFNFGLGHLPPAQSVGCTIFVGLCDPNNYQHQLDLAGWDTRSSWTSVYPILANDFTFFGVPLYFALVGFMLKNHEFIWKTRSSTGALAGIVLVLQFILFSSANMQVAASLDWTAAFVLFFYVPFFSLLKITNVVR